MDGISGSAHSLINLGTAMSQSRVQSALSISAFKKGLDTQAQAAVSLIESVRVHSLAEDHAGSQVDLIV